MDKDTVLKTIGRFRGALTTRGVRPAKVVLFGSYARGDAHEGSDIDVVVVSDDFAGQGYWDRIGILASAIAEVFAPIEAIAMTQEEWENGRSIIAEYARQGETIYSASTAGERP